MFFVRGLPKTLRFPRKTTLVYVGDVAGDGGLDLLTDVGVLPYKFGAVALEHPQHVMEHEDLPVAIRAGADTDCGNGKPGSNLGGKLAGNAFENDRECTRFGH